MNPVEEPRVIHAGRVPITQVPTMPGITGQLAALYGAMPSDPTALMVARVMRNAPARGPVLNSALKQAIAEEAGMTDYFARQSVMIAEALGLIERIPHFKQIAWVMTPRGRDRKKEIETHGSKN